MLQHKWRIQYFGPDGSKRDSFEWFSQHKPTKKANGGLHPGEKYEISRLDEEQNTPEQALEQLRELNLFALQSPKYMDNMDRPAKKADAERCILCGLPIYNKNVKRVRVHDGGASIVTVEYAEELNKNGNESADLGGHPIGNDCLRAHPVIKPFAY